MSALTTNGPITRSLSSVNVARTSSIDCGTNRSSLRAAAVGGDTARSRCGSSRIVPRSVSSVRVIITASRICCRSPAAMNSLMNPPEIAEAVRRRLARLVVLDFVQVFDLGTRLRVELREIAALWLRLHAWRLRAAHRQVAQRLGRVHRSLVVHLLRIRVGLEELRQRPDQRRALRTDDERRNLAGLRHDRLEPVLQPLP